MCGCADFKCADDKCANGFFELYEICFVNLLMTKY